MHKLVVMRFLRFDGNTMGVGSGRFDYDRYMG